MYWEQFVQSEAQTDIGLRRKNNEDSYCISFCPNEETWRRSGHLFIVADGMGGHAVGELASRLAIETIPHSLQKTSTQDPKKALHEAILAANAAIHTRGTQNADFLHMGTTCTTLMLGPAGGIVGHIGDSRAYRVRRDRIDQLTFDHSLEWELERKHGSLKGIIDLSQHRNVITRSLGPEEVIDVDLEGPFPVFPGDTFLLCSDGLSNQVSDPEMGAILREFSPKAAAKLLIELANVRGGPDNSTAVVVRIGDLPSNVYPTQTDEFIENRPGLGWSWLAAFAGGALLVVWGVALLLLGHSISGSILTALSVWGMLVLTVFSIRQQQALRQDLPDETHTRLWRPHRTAVALSSKELFELLASIDGELQRSARDDGWDVDWGEHDRAVKAAERAAQEKRYAKGLRDLARAIGMVMDELPRQPDPGNVRSGS
ncbi:PP2C family protein-serine/threonine phosphatase [Planctomicrobium sp. SH664]|uniref:PP2C family protein-serine/threonine phosphatase n=1 Tax=Planctomicrobium sp. SH664 TaxID=3448125 RepID=UPI003F5B6C69